MNELEKLFSEFMDRNEGAVTSFEIFRAGYIAGIQELLVAAKKISDELRPKEVSETERKSHATPIG